MKILVVEDNPISRKMTRVALEAEGYDVLEAADGKAALEHVGRDLPHLILQDILLPDINGFDLVPRIRTFPGAAAIPILALTGLISKADEGRLAAASFTDYLFKPVEPSFLVSTVRAHLAAHQTSDAKPGQGRVVLAVDDDPTQLKLLATYLGNLGFGVTTAKDGAEALLKAENSRPDAIISDVLMPRVDGFALCMAIRKHRYLAKIPVVLLTNNYREDADQRLAADIGANALVTRTPDCREAIEILLKNLDHPGPPPAKDEHVLEAGHKESILRQLNRQATLSIDLARRCAAQSAQISVLASAAENFLKTGHDIETLLSEILAHYLTVVSFSRGAIFLLDENSRLKISCQIGFPRSKEGAVTDFFGDPALLCDAMGAEDPVAFTAPTGHARFQALLDQAGVRSTLLAPLALNGQPLGVIALFSDTRELDREWLNFSKVINGQISQAVALGRTISRLKYLAAYDPLTSLPNRAHLCKRIEELPRSGRQAGSYAALLRINLDRFEEVNNTLSYENGDELLRQVGKRLRAVVGEADTIARLDADEFAVLIDPLPDRSAATEAARRILSDIESPFVIGGFPLAVHASIGLALYPDNGAEAEVLMRRADMAMRSAKRSGNRFAAYAAELDQYDPGRLTMMAELREAIDNNHLALHYQPKVSLRASRIVGVEALVRWQHPRRGAVRPDQFIPLAEKTGLIQLLTQWVLHAVLDQARAWKRKGWDLSVSMNLSARNVQDPYFPAQAASLLRENGLGPRGLTMEITESALLEDPAKASKVLTDLSRSGVQFSIDDFGTGYSSLAYLKHLPVSEIKIDRCFVNDLMANADNATIVRSTIELGHNLGLSVVAEGVEDRQTWQGLAALGCDDAQGFYMCRPLPAEALEKWIEESEWGLRGESPLRQSASA
jgi:diguanylate cyclase (GGDEF)-like protein